MEVINEDRIKEWAKTYFDFFFQEDDSLMNLDLRGEKFTKQELKFFVDELLTRENKKQATGIRLVDKDLDDDCIKELCRLKWLEVLEVPANNLSEASLHEIAQHLPNLQRLIISGNPNITNLNQLQKLSHLEELFISSLPLKMNTEDFISLVQKTKLRILIIRDSNETEEVLQRLKEELLKNRQECELYINSERILRKDE